MSAEGEKRLLSKMRALVGPEADAWTDDQVVEHFRVLKQAMTDLQAITKQDNVDAALQVAAKLVKDAPRVKRSLRRIKRRIARIARVKRVVRQLASMRVMRTARRRRSVARHTRAPATSSDGPEPPRHPHLGYLPILGRCGAAS